MIQNYGYVPFKIPRSGDGVCTIITFTNRNEAVVASKNDCLPKISVDTLNNTIPDFSYTITPDNKVGVDLGQIFGTKFTLDAAFKYSRVKRINVKLIKPFEVRATRTSVEKEVLNLTKTDPICTKNIFAKNNYVIERVFGAHGIEITLQDSVSRAIGIDAQILNEITVDPTLRNKFLGAATMKARSIALFGYRIWKYEGKPGFDGAEASQKEIDVNSTIKLRESAQ